MGASAFEAILEELAEAYGRQQVPSDPPYFTGFTAVDIPELTRQTEIAKARRREIEENPASAIPPALRPYVDAGIMTQSQLVASAMERLGYHKEVTKYPYVTLGIEQPVDVHIHGPCDDEQCEDMNAVRNFIRLASKAWIRLPANFRDSIEPFCRNDPRIFSRWLVFLWWNFPDVRYGKEQSRWSGQQCWREPIKSSINAIRQCRLNTNSPILPPALSSDAATLSNELTANTPDAKPTTAHADDYRCVTWHGTRYTFTANQAACVKMLWEHWERETPEVGGKTLLEAADCASERLDVVFRDCAAWGKLIVRGKTKGAYRLVEPPTEPRPKANRTRQKK